MNIFLIAKDNMKKKKGDTLVLFALVTTAIIFLYVSISVVTNLNKVIDDTNREINGADYFLVTTSQYFEDIKGKIGNREEIDQIETESGVWMQGAKFYNPDKEREEDSSQLDFIFQNKEVQRNISAVSVLYEGDEFKYNSIIVPLYMMVGLHYQTGDSIAVVYGENTYTFEIYGFTQEVLFSTPTNISIEKCYVSNAFFQDLYKEPKGAANVNMVRAVIKDGISTEIFENRIQKELNDTIPDFQYINNLSVNYESMKIGTGITANIFMAILSVFAMLLIIIALVVIRFTINTSIDRNMKNIGMLQALGYTARQLLLSTVLENVSITIGGILIGFLLSRAATGYIGNLVSSSIGLQWKLPFHVISAGISTFIILFLVMTTTFLSAGKYRKISPLNALRNGIITHNFKKNRIDLEKTTLPLFISLGLKNIMNTKKRNVAILLIVILMSFCCGEAVSVYQNLSLKPDKLIELIGIEVPDIAIMQSSPGSLVQQAEENNETNSNNSILDKTRDKVDGMDKIAQTIRYANATAVCINGENKVSLTCDIYDDCEKLTVNNMVRGRWPRYDNEIVLTTMMCKKLEITLGDVVYLEINGHKEEFLLVGISQGMTNLGRKGMINFAGIQRLNEDLEAASIYVYLEDKVDINDTLSALKTEFSKDDLEVMNYQNYIKGSLTSISNTMATLCFVLIGVAILVIAMIIFLLIKTQIISDSKMFGVYKALGFTTWQLILQTSMGYIPIVAAGSLLGGVVAYVGINPSFILFLAAFGIEKCSMNVNVLYLIGISIFMTLWAEIIAILCAANISRIEPCKMMQE